MAGLVPAISFGLRLTTQKSLDSCNTNLSGAGIHRSCASRPGSTAQSFSLRLVGAAKGVVIGWLSGVSDRDRAEALRGLRLYLPRAALPPTDDEEFYHADLIGLEAVLRDGTRLGQVKAVHDFGAGDTLEILRPEGPPAMVPFTRQVVPVVDLDAGRLVVEPPPGLLEAPASRRRRQSEEAA